MLLLLLALFIERGSVGQSTHCSGGGRNRSLLLFWVSFDRSVLSVSIIYSLRLKFERSNLNRETYKWQTSTQPLMTEHQSTKFARHENQTTSTHHFLLWPSFWTLVLVLLFFSNFFWYNITFHRSSSGRISGGYDEEVKVSVCCLHSNLYVVHYPVFLDFNGQGFFYHVTASSIFIIGIETQNLCSWKPESHNFVKV